MTFVDTRGIPRALFTAGAGLRGRLEGWDAAIRGPVGAVRRIGFLHLDAGAGATTLAAQVLRIASVRRTAPLLAVDASGSGDLATRLGSGVTPPSDLRAAARTSAEATTGLGRGAHGELVLRPAHATADGLGAWLDEAAPIVRFFDIAVTDFGPRHPTTDMAAAAALCDVVCLVSPADRGAAELSRSLAGAMGELPERPRVVLALVDRARAARRAPEVVAAHSPDPVVRVPFDAGLAAGAPARTLAARIALLRLTAHLVTEDAA